MDLRLTSNAAAGPKNGNPRGWRLLGRLASWLLSHRARGLCSFVAPRHPPQQPPAHPMPIYGMGSKPSLTLTWLFFSNRVLDLPKAILRSAFLQQPS